MKSFSPTARGIAIVLLAQICSIALLFGFGTMLIRISKVCSPEGTEV